MAKSNLSELLGESVGPYDGEASDDEGFEMSGDMGQEPELPDSYSLYLDEFSEAMGLDRAQAERVADALMGMLDSRDMREADDSSAPEASPDEQKSLALLLGE